MTGVSIPRVARVCRLWYGAASNPMLWQKVSISFCWVEPGKKQPPQTEKRILSTMEWLVQNRWVLRYRWGVSCPLCMTHALALSCCVTPTFLPTPAPRRGCTLCCPYPCSSPLLPLYRPLPGQLDACWLGSQINSVSSMQVFTSPGLCSLPLEEPRACCPEGEKAGFSLA